MTKDRANGGNGGRGQGKLAESERGGVDERTRKKVEESLVEESLVKESLVEERKESEVTDRYQDTWDNDIMERGPGWGAETMIGRCFSSALGQ